MGMPTLAVQRFQSTIRRSPSRRIAKRRAMHAAIASSSVTKLPTRSPYTLATYSCPSRYTVNSWSMTCTGRTTPSGPAWLRPQFSSGVWCCIGGGGGGTGAARRRSSSRGGAVGSLSAIAGVADPTGMMQAKEGCGEEAVGEGWAMSSSMGNQAVAISGLQRACSSSGSSSGSSSCSSAAIGAPTGTAGSTAATQGAGGGTAYATTGAELASDSADVVAPRLGLG